MAVLLSAGTVWGDDVEKTPLDPLDPTRVISPLTLVQGDGVKIGEGTSFYPQVGVETGYESNTFYSANDPVGAGIIQVLIEAGLGSLSPQRLGDSTNGASPADSAPPTGEWKYEANAYASYSQYISNNSDAQSQGGLGLGFHGNMLVHPEGTVSFYGNDGYDRVLRETNFESRSNDARDINVALLRLDIHPESAFSGSVGYINTLDAFEDNPQYPDRLENQLIGRLNYKFFPVSAVFLMVSQGYNTGIGGADKVTSYPLSAQVGITTALGVHSSLLAQGGYSQGFYASGPDYQAFVGSVYYEYRYSEVSALRFLYSYDHHDSINANFYRDHVFQAWLEHKVDVLGLFISPELRLREYDGLNPPLMGPPTRDDTIAAVAVGVRYQFRAWISASAQYRLVDDATDYRYTGGTMALDPSYVRHEVYAGLRMAY